MTAEEIISLIKEIEKRREIWDKSDPKSNPKGLEMAWAALDATLRIDKKKLVNKWRTLRRQMTTAMENYEEESDIVKAFPYYYDMQFYRDRVREGIEDDLDEEMERRQPMPQQQNLQLPPPAPPVQQQARQHMRRPAPAPGAPMRAQMLDVPPLSHPQPQLPPSQANAASKDDKGDEDFFRSLVPCVNHMNDEELVEFLVKMIKLARRFLYNK